MRYFDTAQDVDSFIECYIGPQGRYASAEFGGSSVWHIKKLSVYPERMGNFLGYFLVHEAGIVVLFKRTIDSEDSYVDKLIGSESKEYEEESIRKIVIKAFRMKQR